MHTVSRVTWPKPILDFNGGKMQHYRTFLQAPAFYKLFKQPSGNQVVTFCICKWLSEVASMSLERRVQAFLRNHYDCTGEYPSRTKFELVKIVTGNFVQISEISSYILGHACLLSLMSTLLEALA
jgi:hypothetical protein